MPLDTNMTTEGETSESPRRPVILVEGKTAFMERREFEQYLSASGYVEFPRGSGTFNRLRPQGVSLIVRLGGYPAVEVLMGGEVESRVFQYNTLDDWAAMFADLFTAESIFCGGIWQN